MIESIRRNFLTLVQQKSDNFHPKDVERVKTDDWTIERYVLVHKKEDQALKALIKSMEWRKSFGVNEFTDDYFPEEMYKIGEFTMYCQDKEGRPIVFGRQDRHIKSSEFGLLIRQFTVYNFEKADRNVKDQGWALINDSGKAGLSNVDMDYSNFMVDVLQNYYPRGVKYMAAVDLPFLLNATAKAIMAFMNEELKSTVKFIKRDQLTQYMDPKFIPVSLDGTYDKDLVVTPSGAKSLEKFADLTNTKFTSEQINKIRSTFKEWLQ